MENISNDLNITKNEKKNIKKIFHWHFLILLIPVFVLLYFCFPDVKNYVVKSINSNVSNSEKIIKDFDADFDIVNNSLLYDNSNIEAVYKISNFTIDIHVEDYKNNKLASNCFEIKQEEYETLLKENNIKYKIVDYSNKEYKYIVLESNVRNCFVFHKNDIIIFAEYNPKYTKEVTDFIDKFNQSIK